MRRIITSAGFLVLLGVSLCGAATALVTGGERILFVGNNMTGFVPPGVPGGLDVAVRSVLASGSINVTTESFALPAAGQLTDIYKEGRATEKIRKGDYDIVVLQGWLEDQDYPTGARDTFFRTVKSFDEVITASGGKTMLFMTYTNVFFASRPDVNNYLKLIDITIRNYDSASILIGGAPVAPVGLVFRNFVASPPPGKNEWLLYESWKGAVGIEEPHGQLPSNYGQLVTAYVFYKVLTGGKSPIGLKQTYYPAADRKIDSVLQYRADLITGQYMATHTTGVLRQGGAPEYPAAGVPGPAPSVFLLDGSRYCHGAGGMAGRASCVFVRSDGRWAVRSLFTVATDDGGK